MPSVTLESLTKHYGRTPALREMDLHVEDGELMVLAGPSGCGKTTTLRLIAGLERVTEGVIRFGGRVMNHVRPRDRDVAMVFQNYALYPHMTARRNLAFGLEMRRVPRPEIDRRVAEASALLGLDALLDRKPDAMSGGEQQRVALGRVLVRRPACALYDEPLSSVDAGLRAQLRGDLHRIHAAAGTTAVYVTHDQEDAMALAKRIAVMADGRLHQVGTPLDVYRRPADRVVAGFIGRTPMNFVPGRLERRGAQLVFTDGGVITIALPDAVADRAAQRSRPRDRNGAATPGVVAGIRPEHLRASVPASRPDHQMALEIDVDDMRSLGDCIDVHGRAGAAALTARLSLEPAGGPGGDQAPCIQGGRLRLGVSPDDVHLFEPGPGGVRI